MLTAVVTTSGGSLLTVHFVAEAGGEEHHTSEDCEFPVKDENGDATTVVDEDGHTVQVCDEGPSPILPELKETAVGVAAFVLLALLMRFFLYPRMRKGVEARKALIDGGHQSAESARAAARGEVAEYEAAIAAVKAEAAAKVDAARLALDEERSVAIAAANARIAEKRSAAAAQADEARAAVHDHIVEAVADVASTAVELAVGKRPDQATVTQAVTESMSAGVR